MIFIKKNDTITLGDNMKKRIFITVMFVIVILISAIVIYKISSNSNNKLNRVMTINDVKFSKAKIEKKNNKYFFTVQLDYAGENAIKAQSFDANILDKSGNTIEVLSGYIGGIEQTSVKNISIESQADLSKAYSITYTVYNE